jgi:hypothetical protein
MGQLLCRIFLEENAFSMSSCGVAVLKEISDSSLESNGTTTALSSSSLLLSSSLTLLTHLDGLAQFVALSLNELPPPTVHTSVRDRDAYRRTSVALRPGTAVSNSLQREIDRAFRERICIFEESTLVCSSHILGTVMKVIRIH